MKNDGLNDAQRAIFMGARRALLSLLGFLEDALGVEHSSTGSREKRRGHKFRAFTGEKKSGGDELTTEREGSLREDTEDTED